METMNVGLQMDAVYTDVKAAFDSINHSLLLAKLTRIGISIKATDWLTSYLLPLWHGKLKSDTLELFLTVK
uniref:Reverse transcriptase domain-containing protein n=1 Tax=Anopheles stephensi TaxID=30069 RepID=A0A182YHD2_ANOST